jgi:1-acyl-sn-glycerol-3-phosphate acyltransferase
MMHNIVRTVKACLLVCLLAANAIILPTILCVFALLAPVVFKPQMVWCRDGIYAFWVDINRRLIRFFLPTRFLVRANGDLDPALWYLAVSNHRSWVDIILIQIACRDYVSFQLKFFLKEVLMYVPMIGPACWALHFPFIRRFTPKQIRKDIKGCKRHNRLAIERACRRYRDEPTVLLNFLEGTRFTSMKHEAKNSPYRHLLPPHAAGVGYALSSLSDRWSAFLDITLIYPADQAITFWSFLKGDLDVVELHIRSVPLLKARGDYDEDVAYKQALQTYLKKMWSEKDQFIEGAHRQ